MEEYKKIIRQIRTAANIGLYGTLFVGILTIAEHYLDKYVWAREITTNEYTHHLFMYVGLVLAVGYIAMILLTLRRQIPKLRQMDETPETLRCYLKLARCIYIGALVVAIILAAIIVITHENTLIMLMMLLFITLALNYPNMYKMKNDMGLDDNTMKELFGKDYIDKE
ncbi:MAG: hypothetical protein K6D59_00900 [Bacteroidales bacterium]|nr:hypothetical protein [Bacteroidales bacterium]